MAIKPEETAQQPDNICPIKAQMYAGNELLPGTYCPDFEEVACDANCSGPSRESLQLGRVSLSFIKVDVCHSPKEVDLQQGKFSQ